MALDYGSYAQAMAGYNPQQQQQQSNILQSILPMALQVGGTMLGSAGGPVGMAAGGAIGTGLGDVLTGRGINAGDIAQGALFGALPSVGMIGKGAKAAKMAEAAEAAGKSAVASDAAQASIKNAAQQAVERQAPVGNIPTNVNPETNVGHVRFTQDMNGSVGIDNANTFRPQAPVASPAPVQQPAVAASPAPVQPPAQPRQLATGSDATSRYTPQVANVTQQLSPMQQASRNAAVRGVQQTMQAAGMKVDNAVANDLANQALDLGYDSIIPMARDAQTLTGRDFGVDNAVNNMVRQAGVGDSVGNPTAISLKGVIDDGARNDLVNQATRGTTNGGRGGVAYTDAQRNVFANNIQDQNAVLAGAGKNGYRSIQEAVDAGDLVKMPTGGYELTSQAINNLNPVDVLQAQRNFSNMAQAAKTQGEGDLYQGIANQLNDRLGDIKITKEGAQNVLSNLKESGFQQSNPAQFEKLQQGLSSGAIGSVKQLRSFTAPWVKASVAYSKGAGGASIFDLAAGGRGSLSKNIMSSGAAGSLKSKAARTLSKITAKPGEPTAFNNTTSGGGRVVSGGGGMSQLGKIAAVARGLGALGLGANAVGTANQANQAQAMLNDPNYQKTQSILNQANAQQRYLGEMAAIRSVFAPTFDSNAGQAGAQAQQLLAQANQNQAARAAASNLLSARAQMGKGGILGGALSLIPGTSQNAYAQQAANAQAQLNSLGIAGSAPGVAQSGSVLPSITNMAGNVGAF